MYPPPTWRLGLVVWPETIRDGINPRWSSDHAAENLRYPYHAVDPMFHNQQRTLTFGTLKASYLTKTIRASAADTFSG
jgi:hypothetical protein